MFVFFRQIVLVAVVAAASIVFWEASDLRSQLLRRDVRPPAFGAAPTASPLPANEAQGSAPIIPGSAGQRFVAWALFVLLLPVITAALATRVFQQQSNTANLVLLFGYTGLDVLAAYLVGGIHVGGVLSGIGYLAALLAVFAYNVWICGFLAKLTEA